MKAIVLFLLLSGCMHRVPLGQPVARSGYSYIRMGEVYYLFATNDEAYYRGFIEICKGKVCRVELSGNIYVLVVSAK